MYIDIVDIALLLVSMLMTSSRRMDSHGNPDAPM